MPIARTAFCTYLLTNHLREAHCDDYLLEDISGLWTVRLNCHTPLCTVATEWRRDYNA
jgi:hypothetical protein